MSIEKLGQRIFKVLLGHGFTIIDDWWESPREGDVLNTEEDVSDSIFEDNEKDQWVLGLRVDREGSFDVIKTLLTRELGEPTHPMGVKEVNNWKVGDALVVHRDNAIEVFEDFQRVSRKRK